MRRVVRAFRCRYSVVCFVRVFSVVAIFGTAVYHIDLVPKSGLLRSLFYSEDEESFVSSPRPACVFPKLDLNNSEIMKFYIKYKRLECATDSDWLIVKNGMFLITESAYRKHPNIHCDAYPIVKVTDFKTKELEPIKGVKNETPIDNDFYRVHCKSSNNSEYNNIIAGIRHDDKVHKRARVTSGQGLDLDVVMLGLDSTSRLAWHRHLPKSRDYFVNVLSGTEMEGYNILGDGTPAALMPILLGHIEEELHEARRSYQHAKPVDDFPWIWDEFKAAGYATAYAEDVAKDGTFQYRLLGFKNQPTDHYFRYFCVAAEPNIEKFLPYCQGSRPRHSVVLDYMRQILTMYPAQRKWLFSFQSQLSHTDNNFLSKMDDDLLEHLQTMHRQHHLDNAIFIMMADHGARFHRVRATEQGKLEERLPYFGIRFPEWFHRKYPEIIRNIKTNSQRLTTPYDVHETLREIVRFTGTGRANISKRGVSMFKEIPIERDCESAQVESHWCACLDWIKEEPSSDIINLAVDFIIDTFNNYTSPYRNLCSVLTVDNVTSASSLKVKDAVLKFKDTKDGGRGRVGLLTDTTKQSKIRYQVTFQTQPGTGRFEVTVVYYVKNALFTLSAKDISRINKYGKGPWCVEKQNSFLRPFCYCKDLLGATETRVSHSPHQINHK